MSQSQNKMFSGPTYSRPIDVSPTTALYNLPTVTVQQSGALNLSGITCVNVIGSFNVAVQAASLVNGQNLLIVATGGVPAKVSLFYLGIWSTGVTFYPSTVGSKEPG